MSPTRSTDARHFPLLPLALTALLGGVLLAAAGDRVRGLLASSASVVALSLVIAVPLGAWLAFLLAKTNVSGRHRALWSLIAMLMLPLYLHAAAWQAAIGQLGWWTLSSWTQGNPVSAPVDPLLSGVAGVAWIHGLAAAPWVALILMASLTAVDRSQEEAALLDANWMGVLRRVTLRHAAAGVLVAALWVAVMVASEMTVTDLLRVRTFAEEIYTQANMGLFDRGADTPSTFTATGLFSGLLLLILLGAVAMAGALAAVGRWLSRIDGEENSPQAWRLSAPRWLGTLLLWTPLWLMLAVPVINLACQAGVTVERTPDGWLRGWSTTKLVSAVVTAPWLHRRELWLSTQLGVAVATSATILGGVLAWIIHRLDQPGSPKVRRSIVRWFAILVSAACLVVPGPVVGVLAIRLLNHPWDSPLAWLTWLYDHTQLAPWLVQMVRATPIAALILLPAWSSIPQSTLAAARSDGASRLGLLVRIAAPMRWRAVAVAWLATLAISVGELAATILVLPPGPSTITIRIFSLLHYGVEDRVAGIGLCMMGFFVALAILSARLLKPRGDAPHNPP